MNGVDYSASIMVRIVHATFCTCALIRKNETRREVAATKRPLQTTKGQENGGRKTRRGSCIRSYIQLTE